MDLIIWQEVKAKKKNPVEVCLKLYYIRYIYKRLHKIAEMEEGIWLH